MLLASNSGAFSCSVGHIAAREKTERSARSAQIPHSLSSDEPRTVACVCNCVYCGYYSQTTALTLVDELAHEVSVVYMRPSLGAVVRVRSYFHR